MSGTVTRVAKIAVIATHGISKIQRYEIQDTVANELSKHLNARGRARWTCDVFFPNAEAGGPEPFASALRIHHDDDDAATPKKTIFDIYEAYWSPIDKNKTTFTSVLAWMIKSLFVPLNTHARLPANAKKLLFDLTYAFGAVFLLAALAVATASLFALGYGHFAAEATVGGSLPFTAILSALAASPLSIANGLKPPALAAVIAAITGSYILVQFFVSMYTWGRGKRKTRGVSAATPAWQTGARTLALLMSAGLLLTSYLLPASTNPYRPFGIAVLWFVFMAMCLRGLLVLTSDFFVNRLGDVQIYTTKDDNSANHALHDKILDTVTTTIQQVLASGGDGAAYERIYILAHSLGSTISMDALIRLHQMVEGGTLEIPRWRKIRGFVTFGTALEKTRFFYDIQNPTLSQSYEQWRNDTYGHLFTKDSAVLRYDNVDPASLGIYWANYWYLRDLVANEICSYKSTISAGSAINSLKRLSKERSICENILLADTFSPSHVWIHSDYLADDNFWSGVDVSRNKQIGALDILTAGVRLD